MNNNTINEFITIRATKTGIARITTRSGFYSHNLFTRGIKFKLQEETSDLMIDLSVCFLSDPQTNTYQDAADFRDSSNDFGELWLDRHHFERRQGLLTWLRGSALYVNFAFDKVNQPQRFRVCLSNKNTYLIFERYIESGTLGNCVQ